MGIISTSAAATPFTATWDLISVSYDDPQSGTASTGSNTGTNNGGTAGTGTSTGSGTATGTGNGTSTGSGTTGGTTGGTSGSSGNQPTDIVVIEVEDHTDSIGNGTHQWVAGSKPGASGASRVTTPNSGALKPTNSGTPMMSYNATFASSGVYLVWMRGWGDTDSIGRGHNDSVHVGINGVLANATAMDEFPPQWSWSNSTRQHGAAKIIVPSAGVHTINVWMREDGLEIDKVVFKKEGSAGSTDAPTGLGPN